MNFLIVTIIMFLLCYFCRKSIKKNAVFYYIGSIIIGFITIFANLSTTPNFLNKILDMFFRYGTASTAIFTIVMYSNAFVKFPFLQKNFMPIRAELSIIGCILAYAHNIFTGQTYFVRLFTMPDKLKLPILFATIISIILLCLMTPLFITSFTSVRKKMKPKKWKQLQRLAYVFYGLIYIHIMLLMLPSALAGGSKYIINVVVYSIVFITYGVLRIYKYRLVKR